MGWLINPGDLITYKVLGKQEYAIVLGNNDEFTDIQVLEPGNVTFHSAGFDKKHVTNISELIVRYEQQKLRADRAEKRWSELRERMEHDEKEAFGEGDVIAHTVHNYVLELMEGLEEDGE